MNGTYDNMRSNTTIEVIQAHQVVTCQNEKFTFSNVLLSLWSEAPSLGGPGINGIDGSLAGLRDFLEDDVAEGFRFLLFALRASRYKANPVRPSIAGV